MPSFLSRRRAVFIAALAVLAIVGVVVVSGSGHKINQDNYAKIQTGMTEADVQQILGSPTATETANGAMGISGSKQTWKDGEKTITVVFIVGKVIGCHKTGF